MTKITLFIRNSLLVLSVVVLSACGQEDAKQSSLVALGDSITYGANLEDSDSTAYPYLIGEEARFDVHNLAVSGWQIGQVMEALREDTEYQQTVKDADFIAMTIGGNDLLEIISIAETETAGDQEVMEEFVLQELGGSVVFDKVGALIEEIQSMSDAQILLYNIYNPFPSHSKMYRLSESLLPEVNAAFVKVTESYENVYLADAYSAYLNKQEEYIIVDDIHPTEEGQAVLAEIGLDALELK